jgi:hypothetical protein
LGRSPSKLDRNSADYLIIPYGIYSKLYITKFCDL